MIIFHGRLKFMFEDIGYLNLPMYDTIYPEPIILSINYYFLIISDTFVADT